VIRSDKPGEERTYHVFTLKDGKIKPAQKKEIIGADRNKLAPTDIGTVVTDFLMAYFPGIMDYNFTASVEKEFDAIAEGELVWTDALDKFYRFFHPIVEATSAVKTEHKVGERQVGTDPQSGEPIFVKIGRYGPIAQIGQAHPDDKLAPKPRFASLMKGQSIESITLEEVLKLFDLPRTIGEFEGEEMSAGIGRFGPFILHNSKYIAIPKTLNPLTITKEEAIQLIEDKRKKETQRHIKSFEKEGIEILNGRYGAYIAFDGANYRLPKNTDPEKLTPDECMKIISSSKKKKN
jgi:DNA topoisomerase-1